MPQRQSRSSWKWPTVWKACSGQDTWECWMCTGHNPQRWATDSVRTRSWSGGSQTTVSKILMQDLGMKCVVAKSLPQLLLPEQKEHRAAVANDLIQPTANELDVLKVITGDESRVYTWSWNEGPVVPMEATWVSMPHEGEAKSQWDQDHVNCFLTGQVLYAMSVPLQAKQVIRSTASIFFVSWKMQNDRNSYSYGQPVIGSFITTTPPLQPRSGALWLLAFPKTKITLEREEISDHWWDSGKYDGAAPGNRRTVWGPQVPDMTGTEVSLSYVQCFLYLLQ